MCESLQLHQGPGLNGLFQTQYPLSQEYDAISDITSCTLQAGYTLRIPGNHQDFPLRPETLEVLDILVCKLEENKSSRYVELSLEEFLPLAGYDITKSNKNVARLQLQESADLLGELRVDWTEKEGRYTYRNVKLFDEITCRGGRAYARFSKEMAQYLLNRPTLSLPLSLFSVSRKFPNGYLLGRRCLLHNVINKGREPQVIRIRSLLDVCHRIPRPDPEKKWYPSKLKNRVIVPFEETMKHLVDKRILASWEFQAPVCRDDYDGFADGMVEFQVRGTAAAALLAAPALLAESNAEFVFDYDAFLALR